MKNTKIHKKIVMGNCAMSGHLIIVGVSNDIVSKCDRFSSYYYDIYEDNYLKRKE